MDRTCKMVKGQVNAINYFLTVIAMQESLTYPHSLSPCNVMGLSDSFVWVFCRGWPPDDIYRGTKDQSIGKKKKKSPRFFVLGTIKAKHRDARGSQRGVHPRGCCHQHFVCTKSRAEVLNPHVNSSQHRRPRTTENEDQESSKTSCDIYTGGAPAEPPGGKMSPHLSGSLIGGVRACHLNLAATA